MGAQPHLPARFVGGLRFGLGGNLARNVVKQGIKVEIEIEIACAIIAARPFGGMGRRMRRGFGGRCRWNEVVPPSWTVWRLS